MSGLLRAPPLHDAILARFVVLHLDHSFRRGCRIREICFLEQQHVHDVSDAVRVARHLFDLEAEWENCVDGKMEIRLGKLRVDAT